MRKFIIVLIIVLMLIPDKILPAVVNLSTEELDAYGIAGLMAYLPASLDAQPTPAEECKCNKTTGKISYDGGTSLTDCVCKNGAGNCKCINDKTATMGVKERLPRPILITQPSKCSPCKRVDKDVILVLKNDDHKKAGWTVGNSKNCTMQVLDIDNADDLKEIERLGIKVGGVPTFFLLEKSGITKTSSGYMSYKDFIKWAKPSKKNSYSRTTSRRWHLDGSYNPERDLLIRHLESVHNITWDLSVLTYAELLAIHDDDHNGNLGAKP